jgi:hypothetical protein
MGNAYINYKLINQIYKLMIHSLRKSNSDYASWCSSANSQIALDKARVHIGALKG